MAANKLTDRQIAEIYRGLSTHYEACLKDGLTPPVIYNNMLNGIYSALSDTSHSLNKLDNYEKQKVITVVNTFFYATPSYRQVPRSKQGETFFNDGNQPPKKTVPNPDAYRAHYYRYDDGPYFNWIIINNNYHNRYHHHHHNHSSWWSWGSSHHGHHSNSGSDDKKTSEALAFLALVSISAAILASAFVATYYLLSDIVDGMERLIFNEGIMQAISSLFIVGAATSAATIIADYAVYSSILSLAVSAGVSNPGAWAVFAVYGLGLIGGAVINYVAQTINKSAFENADAIDPQDASRFTLTASEESNLVKSGIDPIKVKCVLVALRAEIGDKPVPSVMNRRFFADDNSVAKTLEKVRALRSGRLSVLDVGDMAFNCLNDALNLTPPPFTATPAAYSSSPSAPVVDDEAPPAYVAASDEVYTEYQYIKPTTAYAPQFQYQ